MITGIEMLQLSENAQEYYDILKQDMLFAASKVKCAFELIVIDNNECTLTQKLEGKTLTWEHVVTDGVTYILDALVLQSYGEALDVDQQETLQDAIIETVSATRFIAIDATHGIEVSASGLYYPQHKVNLYTNAPGTRWAYYRKGDRAQTCRSYATERAARKFIAANA